MEADNAVDANGKKKIQLSGFGLSHSFGGNLEREDLPRRLGLAVLIRA
jgi:hypothetical protein